LTTHRAQRLQVVRTPISRCLVVVLGHALYSKTVHCEAFAPAIDQQEVVPAREVLGVHPRAVCLLPDNSRDELIGTEDLIQYAAHAPNRFDIVEQTDLGYTVVGGLNPLVRPVVMRDEPQVLVRPSEFKTTFVNLISHS